ncbi:MAG: hypothetical protein GY707_07075, partial [Desulfobacteraceae bacterium]|nr:hypothetical protein [Desulfobacteraceae bacterium]
MTIVNATTDTDVALICMPFMATDRPSLGLSLIKSGLTVQGVSSSIHYLNLTYAKMIGLDKINTLSFFPEADLVKEWIFTESCWGKDEKREAQYFKNVIAGGVQEHKINKPEIINNDYKDEILYCKDKVEPFLEYCINEIPWSNYKIVGFSSIFQQQIPSLSLARRLKKKFPHLFIIFGGASCKSESGRALLQSFPFVDAVCTGEGDIVFPQFARTFLDKNEPVDFPGIILQTDKPNIGIPKISPSELNDLPYPDFHDYF